MYSVIYTMFYYTYYTRINETCVLKTLRGGFRFGYTGDAIMKVKPLTKIFTFIRFRSHE